MFILLQFELILAEPFFRSTVTAEFNSSKYECREDQSGLNFYRLIFTEFVFRLLHEIFFALYYRAKGSCKNLTNWKQEFDLPDVRASSKFCLV